MSIEESADILFKGIQDNRLYIGEIGFRNQEPWRAGELIERIHNIVNERNPIIPEEQ